MHLRRIALLGLLAAGALAAGASPALATFHLNMVNEVMLASSTGDASEQFVEFLDNGGVEELFTPVFAPYRLEVYDANANLLAAQTLNPNGLRAAADADTEYLVSTAAVDAAFHVTGNERLAVKLPLSAGQVCFAGGAQIVSCMTYGRIRRAVTANNPPFGTGTVHGPVPPNGLSDQRQPNGSVIAAAPTPGAPNRTAPSPPRPAPFTGVQFVSRRVAVEGRRALVRLRCPTDAVSSCSGEVTLTHGHRLLGRARFAITTAGSATVAVPLAGGHTHPLWVRGRAVATDGDGRTATTSARLKLVPSAATGTLITARTTRLGVVLANSRGFTLYLFARDHTSRSTCYGACAGVWPPLLTAGAPRAGAGVDANLLGVTRRRDGTLQVTYNRHPLYLYLGDSGPRQTHGEGVLQFGARWYAVATDGRAVRR